MVGDRRFPRATILGSETVPHPPTIAFQSLRQVAYIVMLCGRCTIWLVLYFQTGAVSWSIVFCSKLWRHFGQLLRQRPSILVLSLRRPCRCLLRQQQFEPVQTQRRHCVFFPSVVWFPSRSEQVDSGNFLLFQSSDSWVEIQGRTSGAVCCRQRDGDTSTNERTNDGTDDDLNDGANDGYNMSPTSEESSGDTSGFTMRVHLRVWRSWCGLSRADSVGLEQLAEKCRLASSRFQ